MVEAVGMANRLRWRGQELEIDVQALLDRAASILKEDPPEEALRYKDWAVDVDGQAVSVKWLFALATGADYAEFTSQIARRALREIGLTPYIVSQTAIKRPSARADKRALRAEFMRQVQTLLPDKLPAQARHCEFKAQSNWLQVLYAEFGGMHYELRLTRSYHEVAIHFESSREASLDRLSVFEPEVDRLAAEVGYPVIAEPWGSYWARVAIILDKGPLTIDRAEMYADLMGRFVGASFSLVRDAYVRRPPRGRKVEKSYAAGSAEANAHALLDAKMAEIKEFLRGRSLRPTEEVLCDWVQFCYSFHLYSEAHQLFDLVDRRAVNDWAYQRASKMADVSRMKVQ
jgi:hypothetical protein